MSVSWDAVPNAAKYRVESLSPPAPLRWAVASESVTGISHTVTGLTCYEHHGVRVSAYGDGPNRAAAWGEPSKPLSVSNTECLPPTFNASSYAFSVPTDAEGGSPVGGQVSAVGSEGADDSVAYSITQGDEDGKFAIDAGTGNVPPELGGLAGLWTLELSSNRLTGGYRRSWEAWGTCGTWTSPPTS